MKWDPSGAVFAPALERGITTPIYSFGGADGSPIKDPVFTCPVSAIPDEVWTLLDLFLTCRAMKALPKAGGVLDQPYVVRRSWPVMEAEVAPMERRMDAAASMGATAALLGAITGARVKPR